MPEDDALFLKKLLKAIDNKPDFYRGLVRSWIDNHSSSPKKKNKKG